MDTHVAQLSTLDRLWAWFELHRKQTLWGAGVVSAVGLIAGFLFWHQNARQTAADDALSQITSSGFSGQEQGNVPALLKVVADYPGTDAASRALLLAGAALYSEGKYAEARSQFDRFLQDFRDSPFAVQAQMGVATCFESEGKTNDAVRAYMDIVQHDSTDNVAPQARLNLAWLYEKQGKLDQARDLYLELSRAPYGSISSEAAIHLQSLFARHPELVPQRPAAASPRPALQMPHS